MNESLAFGPPSMPWIIYVQAAVATHENVRQTRLRCAEDPEARHGPYYEWGHMKGGKLVHRTVTAEQAALLRRAIANYRKAKKLMKAWEHETERLVENEAPHDS